MEYVLKAIFRQLKLDYKPYMLVNNYGYTTKNDKYRVDIRHVLNVYGVSTDYWSMKVFSQETDKMLFERELDDMKQEELMELIKKYT